MKHLALLRHAKSSWDDPGIDDFDRPLNDRGWKAARRIGREMKQRRLRFDLVLASTAARVRQTIDGVQQGFDFEAPIRFEQGIYLANAEALLDLVRGLPEAVEAALLVGHNPGLERLILELTRDDAARLRQRVAVKYPTATLALVELAANHWSEVGPNSGEIVDLIFPKHLA